MTRKLKLILVVAIIAALGSVATVAYAAGRANPDHVAAWNHAKDVGCIPGNPADYYSGTASRQEIYYALLSCSLAIIDGDVEIGSGTTTTTSTSTTTTQPPTTTTTQPPTTTTTVAPTTTTQPPTTTTTVAPTTTTTTLPPSTTTTTTLPPSTGKLSIGPSDNGRTFTNLNISNPNGDCIEIEGATNVTIKDSVIGPCGHWPSVVGKAIYVLDSYDIDILNNQFVGESRNGVQFDKVNGGTIVGNSGVWPSGASFAEDLISIYASHNIDVLNNVLSGGGPSDSGSCIMTGDANGSFIFVSGNVCTNPGQVGIGVAGGHDITVTGNTITSSSLPWSNVGGYVWDFYGSGSCYNITYANNDVEWYNSSGSRNDFWNGGGCG